VHKTLNVVGFTANGPGWQFTLEGCGVGPLTGTTGADGVVEFPDLPPAIGCSYTITETLQPGWTPQFVTQAVQPQQGGETVKVDFLNIRDVNPPCVDPADPRCAPPPPPPTPTSLPEGRPTAPRGPEPPMSIEQPTASPASSQASPVPGPLPGRPQRARARPLPGSPAGRSPLGSSSSALASASSR
jgi:hypothetical protein